MEKDEYINKLFEKLDFSLMDEAKARSKTRRLILELRRLVAQDTTPLN